MSSTIQPLSCDQGGMQFPHRSRVGAQGGGVGQQQVNSSSLSEIERPFDGEAPAPGEGGGPTHQPFNYSSVSVNY